MAKKRKTSTHDTADSSNKRAHSEKGGQKRSAAEPADDEARDDEKDEDPGEDETDDENDDDENDEPRSDVHSRPASLLGLRLRTWLLLGGVVAIAGYYIYENQPARDARQTPAIGEVVAANITLVTADRKDLDCMAGKGVGAYRCGFSNEKTQSTVDEQNRLRPFMTLDRTLTLIPGLFLEPAIKARYDREPPDKPRDQLKRFTAKCKVKLIGTLDGVRLRWRPDSPWEPRQNDVRVGTISGCRIEG